jgi:hypothetical protein
MIITEELYRLTEAFAIANLGYAVCGGLAVAIHGRPRLTLDIDVVVASEDVDAAVRIAAKTGFDDLTGWVPLPANPFGIDRLFRVNKFEGADYLTLDILEADSRLNSILVDREAVEIEGKIIQLLSRAALIKMKSASSRLKDQLDVELLNDQADER